MPCWRSWPDIHSGHPGQVPIKTVSSKSPVTLPASVLRCQIDGALQPGRVPPSYRPLAVPRLFPQGGVPFPRAAPRCAWRSPSNTSAVVSTCPSLRSHHTGDRQREFRVLPGFNGQLFAAAPALKRLVSLPHLLKSKQDEVAEQRGDKPREQQDDAVVGRSPPNPGIPEHFHQRVIASYCG